MPRLRVLTSALAGLALGILLLCGSCSEERQTLGQAYVAPQTLNVRSQVSQKSPPVAKLKHADKVDIVDVQRRMVKVKAPSGAEGWVDSLDLISPEQMKQLDQERATALALPSQGGATAFEELNIHVEPTRRSPAFARIAEGGSVVVLGRAIAVKNAPARRTSSLVVERPKPLKRARKEQQDRGGFRLPPKPRPPKPPENWKELSAELIDAPDRSTQAEQEKKKAEAAKAAAAAKAAEAKKPPVMEDWTLIRTKKDEIGWVLTRNLLFSIPDEVAQYAEGHRITAYFELGSVQDVEKGLKHHWLWTTLSTRDPIDFDSWRVFIWNTRRHRYETSFRKRDLQGYFPVRVAINDGKSVHRSFDIVTKDDDNQFRKRTYTFDGTLVRLSQTQDYRRETEETNASAGGIDTAKLGAKSHPGWFRRQWNALTRRFQK